MRAKKSGPPPPSRKSGRLSGEMVAVAAAVPLGKPKKQLTKLTRRPVEDIVKMERFDGAPLKG